MSDNILNIIENEYFQGIANDIANAKHISKIYLNKSDSGDIRESVLLQFLKSHLPMSCSVTKGGAVFDSTNNCSNQIDILVTSNNNIHFSYFDKHTQNNKAVHMIEGCLAAISVKSNINSESTINEVLSNLASIPKMPESVLERINPFLTHREEYLTFPKKVSFTFEGLKPNTALETIKKYYINHPNSQKIDLFIVNNSYCIVKIGKDGGKTRDGTIIPEGEYYLMDLSKNKSPGTLPLLQLILTISDACQWGRHMIFDFQKYINAFKLE